MYDVKNYADRGRACHRLNTAYILVHKLSSFYLWFKAKLRAL